jgi:hypothetical protein
MRRGAYLLATVVVVGACGGVEEAKPGGQGAHTETGTLALTVAGAAAGVASVDIKVVGGNQSCADPALAEARVDLSAGHSETIFLLPPGDVLVCVSAFDASGAAIDTCHGDGHATVMAGVTSQLDLSLTCTDPRGGLDVDVTINQAPVFTDLTVTPGRSITTCQSALMSVDAHDPDGGTPTISWFALAPGGGTLNAEDRSAAFHADAAGTYTIEVVATDAAGASSTLTFTIEVKADDNCPAACTTGQGRYEVTDDVVTDDAFGRRLWQRGFGPGMPYADAVAYCAGLQLEGLGGWRVPTDHDLLTLLLKPAGLGRPDACVPAIDQVAFRSPPADAFLSFWTTTEGLPSQPPIRFVVDFSDGRAKPDGVDDPEVLVRCLHDPR